MIFEPKLGIFSSKNRINRWMTGARTTPGIRRNERHSRLCDDFVLYFCYLILDLHLRINLRETNKNKIQTMSGSQWSQVTSDNSQKLTHAASFCTSASVSRQLPAAALAMLRSDRSERERASRQPDTTLAHLDAVVHWVVVVDYSRISYRSNGVFLRQRTQLWKNAQKILHAGNALITNFFILHGIFAQIALFRAVNF